MKGFTMKNYIIALDGPAGAGKSTLSKMLAKKLGISYIDTGAMYRASAIYALESGVDPTVDSEKLQKLLKTIEIDFRLEEDEQKIYLNDVDVSREIREPNISGYASAISAIPFVRDHLVVMQRRLAEGKPVLMDGRDIGTNVFPNADIKIYLTADVDDRARRRHTELKEKGDKSTYEQVLDEMIKRDENDKNREYAPLKKADDAILADTTGKELSESFELLYNLIKKTIN